MQNVFHHEIACSDSGRGQGEEPGDIAQSDGFDGDACAVPFRGNAAGDEESGDAEHHIDENHAGKDADDDLFPVVPVRVDRICHRGEQPVRKAVGDFPQFAVNGELFQTMVAEHHDRREQSADASRDQNPDQQPDER